MYVLQNWTFTPGGEGAGLIEIPGIFSIEEFALITNLTRNIPLFDPAEHEATIVLSENGTTTTLTLSQNTSFCSSTDELQIVLYDTNSGNEVGLTDTQLRATPVPVSVSGVATAANQSTANSSLSSIDGKLPAQVSGRVPVDIGSASVTITGPVTVSNEVEVKNDTGNPVPTAPDVQRGGGAITATTQRVTLATDGPGVASLSNIDSDLGSPADVAATTDTGTFSLIALCKRALQNWTTLLGRIPALQSGAVPVGDNSGSLTVDGRAYRAAVTITRPANTTTYAAGDVVGDTGGSAIITLSNIGPSGGYVLIQSVSLVFSDSTVISGMGSFRLHFYTASPTAIADNAAFDLVSGERATYMGYVDIPAPLDLGSSLYTQTDYPGRLIKLASSSTTLYAELETRGAYTPASATTIDVRVTTLEAGL